MFEAWLKNFFRVQPETPASVPIPRQLELPVFDDDEDDEEAPMGLSAYKYTSADGLLYQDTIASTALDKTHTVDDTKAHDRGYTHGKFF